MRGVSINKTKTKGVNFLGQVDIQALQDKVLQLDQAVWEAKNQSKPNNFDVLNEARHIVFKFIEDFYDWRTSATMPIWEEWKELVVPILHKAVEPYGYEQADFSRIMLALLPAGAKIKRHVDGSPAAQFPHKIHIPILTNQDTFFCFDGQKMQFEEGHAYEVNNNTYHWAENSGQSDRVHLIFEYYPIQTNDEQ